MNSWPNLRSVHRRLQSTLRQDFTPSGESWTKWNQTGAADRNRILFIKARDLYLQDSFPTSFANSSSRTSYRVSGKLTPPLLVFVNSRRFAGSPILLFHDRESSQRISQCAFFVLRNLPIHFGALPNRVFRFNNRFLQLGSIGSENGVPVQLPPDFLEHSPPL